MDRAEKDQDTEIVELLGRLKEAGPAYPPRLYTARRAAVIATLAALPIGGAIAIGVFAKLVNVVKGMSVIDKIILGVEVAAITAATAYGATAAYIYRHELQALLFPEPTTTIPTLAPPQEGSPVPGAPGFVSPVPEETPSGTVTPVPTGTILLTDTNVPAGDQPAPTQVPAQPTRTNPGLHLGQTRTPRPTSGP